MSLAAPRAGVDYPGSYGWLRAWFASDSVCLDYLDWLRWPDGFSCPICRSVQAWRLQDGRWSCGGCGISLDTIASLDTKPGRARAPETDLDRERVRSRLIPSCLRRDRNAGDRVSDVDVAQRATNGFAQNREPRLLIGPLQARRDAIHHRPAGGDVEPRLRFSHHTSTTLIATGNSAQIGRDTAEIVREVETATGSQHPFREGVRRLRWPR